MVGEGTFSVVHKAVWWDTVVAAKIISVPSERVSSVMKEIETCRNIRCV